MPATYILVTNMTQYAQVCPVAPTALLAHKNYYYELAKQKSEFQQGKINGSKEQIVFTCK